MMALSLANQMWLIHHPLGYYMWWWIAYFSLSVFTPLSPLLYSHVCYDCDLCIGLTLYTYSFPKIKQKKWRLGILLIAWRNNSHHVSTEASLSPQKCTNVSQSHSLLSTLCTNHITSIGYGRLHLFRI